MRALAETVTRVYTGAETRAFDQRAIREFGISGSRLMHRAGRAAFAALRRRWPEAGAISVVCGAGNNAGDGYVIAGQARDAGLDVQLIQVADPARLGGDAQAAREFAEARLGVTIAQSPGGWRITGEVVVDALLGTGVQGTVRAPYRDAIAAINAAGKPVLAVDLPSGVDADSGGLLTEEPVRADLTVSFVAAKLGLVTGAAVDYVGALVVDDLGLPATVRDQPGVAILDGHDLPALDRRRGAHKGDFGRLLIVGGELDMGGAALLAGEAALRTGVGLAHVATRAVNRAAIIARRPELMVRETSTPGDVEELAAAATAIVIGPGLGRGDWGRALLGRCLAVCAAMDKPLLVDADGLNIIADSGSKLPPGSVITPHPGEAARLLGKDTAWLGRHRPQAAALLSDGLSNGLSAGSSNGLSAGLSAGGAVAVLKGAGTLIASAGVVRSVCVDGNPGMATAGSGDVLSGIIGALLGRGLAPIAAAELGVWLHARAGDEARARGQAALLASDLVDALRLTA